MNVQIQPRQARGFYLTVQGTGTDYGVTLHETNGKVENVSIVARLGPRSARRVQHALQQAVTASGHGRTVLSATRKAPIELKEDVGVKLALTLFAIEGVRKSRRLGDMTTTISHMATEEAYYWYAKSTGPDAARVRRAFRIFLAED